MKDFSATDQKQALKLTSKPAYVNQKIFNENLVAGHKIKETLKLKKLRYDGMVILDLSKTLDYNYIKKKIWRQSQPAIYWHWQLETEDVYEDFWKTKNRFNNSDYLETNHFYDKTNKKSDYQVQRRTKY